MSILEHRVLTAIALSAVVGANAGAQTGGFVAGSREIFAIDFASVQAGALPPQIKLLSGKASIVDKDGSHMVRATEPTDLLFNLRENLPDAFTLEFEIIPKKCCNPVDLMFEGTPSMGRSPTSMQVEWHPAKLAAVGGGEHIQVPMPGEISEVVPSQLTKVQASFEGGAFKLFTNDRLVMDLPARKFAHGRVLRVSLGGQDTNEYAVYLGKLRIAASGAATAAPPGQQKSGAQQTSAPPSSNPPTTSDSSPQRSGSTLPSAIGGITVTQGSSGPVVSWAAPAIQSTYSVKRWKVDDAACCNTASAAGLTTTTWQDAALPRAGTYTYEVTATFAGGSAKGQSQFSYVTLVGGRIATIVPTDTATTATLQQAASASRPPITVPANLAASSLAASGTSGAWGILLSWTSVPSSVGYRVYRMVAGSSNPGQVVTVFSMPDASGSSYAIDPSTVPSTPYTYWVEARFADGTFSAPSNTATLVESKVIAISRIQNLKVSLGAATTLDVPSGIGTGTIKVPANALTWSWDPIPMAVQYIASYTQPATPAPVRAIVPQDYMNPRPPVPTFTRTIAQGETVQFCVNLAQVPDPSPNAPDSTPWTCLTTKVPVPVVAGSSSTTPTGTAPISSTQRTVTTLSTGPAPWLRLMPFTTQPTIYGSPTTAYVSWYPVAGAVSYRVNRVPVGITSWTTLTPAQFTDLGLNDVVPDRTKTYTYEVTAFQADGKFGASTATFTPPAALDPGNFTAYVQSDGSVELQWYGIGFPNMKYFISGPGTGSGVLVTTDYRYTVKGLSPGTYTWTIAANYEGGGVITPASAWPKATATIAAAAPVVNHVGRYAIFVDALRAENQTIDVDTDGKGDEVYVSAFVMTFDRKTNKLLQQASVRSTAMGDVSVVGPPARTLAGSASTNGGIRNNDLVSKVYAETSPGATSFSQFVLWQGTLTDSVEAITIRPMIWESDNNTGPYGTYRYLLESNASKLGYGGSIVEAQMKALSLQPVSLAAKTDFAVYRNNADRPIGLFLGRAYTGTVWLDPLYTNAQWSDQVIVLTREAIEAALNATPSTNPVGVIPISFRDVNFQPDQHQYDMSGLYTLYLKVVRLP